MNNIYIYISILLWYEVILEKNIWYIRVNIKFYQDFKNFK